ncbi:TPA: hypothetical protein ACPUUO_004789 [Klebsiella pneumoniae]
MKTIDLLVQELPALGGFPDGAIEAGFLCSKDTLYFVNKDGDCPSEWRISMNYEVEDRYVEVTREQYEAELAAKNEGWIEWGGGECPVPRGTLVDVRYRDGKQLNALSANYGTLNPRDASFVFWRNYGCEKDIIAYRLHQPQEAVQVKADDEADLNECIGQDAAPVWNGEGLPPVGCVCERSWAGDEWQSCKILFASGQIVVVKLKESGREDAYNIGDVTFRPILPTRSEAERKRDEAVAQLNNFVAMGKFALDEDLACAVYDAIAAGKIPGVKLDD